jgi:DNA-binding GntR family transcriptional regulator
LSNASLNWTCRAFVPPGERLNHDEIAARRNVSRQPVNSALAILRANGLVEDTGRRSVIVTRFDPHLFSAIYDFRKVVEPFAVRLAGRSLTGGHRRQAELVMRAGEKAMERGTLSELLRTDLLFHEMIYSWSGNQVIEASMRTNWHHIRRSMADVLRDSTVIAPAWEEHNAIVEELFSGNLEKAADTMENHIEFTYRAIFRSFSNAAHESGLSPQRTWQQRPMATSCRSKPGIGDLFMRRPAN